MRNRIISMGPLTRDPELRHTQTGTAVASFTLAVDREDVYKRQIQHSVYMSSAYYEQVFGQTPEENAVLVSYDTQADGDVYKRQASTRCS